MALSRGYLPASRHQEDPPQRALRRQDRHPVAGLWFVGTSLPKHVPGGGRRSPDQFPGGLDRFPLPSPFQEDCRQLALCRAGGHSRHCARWKRLVGAAGHPARCTATAKWRLPALPKPPSRAEPWEIALAIHAWRQETEIYGAKLVENVIQALACLHITETAMRVKHLTQGLLLPAHQVHDELVFVVDEHLAEQVRDLVILEMSKSPEWMPGVPWQRKGGLPRPTDDGQSGKGIS